MVLGVTMSVALGWLVAGWGAGNHAGSPASVATDSGGKGLEWDGSSVRTLMVAVRGAGSPAERLRATIALADFIPVGDFEKWLGPSGFDLRDGGEIACFHALLIDRWMREAPDSLLAFAFSRDTPENQGIIELFGERDPARFLAYLKTHGNREGKMAVIGQLISRDPSAALAAFHEITAESPSSSSSSTALAMLSSIARDEPAALESLLDSLPADWRGPAERALITRRLEKSFDAELAVLRQRPDGLDLYQRCRSYVTDRNYFEHLSKLPQDWIARLSVETLPLSTDPGRWLTADLAQLGFSPDTVERIRMSTLSSVGRSDAAEILGLVGSVITRGEEKAALFRNVFSRPGIDAAETLIAKLASGEDRQAAREIIAAADADHDPIRSEPLGAADWLNRTLSGQDPEGLERMPRQWDRDQIAALADAYRNVPEERKTRAALAVMAASHDAAGMDLDLEGEAILRVMQFPPVQPEALPGECTDYSDLSSDTSSHAGSLVQVDPAAAIAWVSRLPEGHAKEAAQKQLVVTLWQYDPVAARSCLAALSDELRGQLLERNPELRGN